MSDDWTARAITQELLDRGGRGLLQGDFEAYLSCFLLPMAVETYESRRLISTTEEMRAVFEALRRHFRAIGLTDLARHCVSASFQNRDTIWETHETRMVCHGAILPHDPFPSFAVLSQTEAGWKMTHSQYAIPPGDGTIDAIMHPDANLPGAALANPDEHVSGATGSGATGSGQADSGLPHPSAKKPDST